jgi:hypothetical protein
MSKSCVYFKKIVFTKGFTWFGEKNETRTCFVKIEKIFLCNNQSWMSKGTHIIIGLFEADETLG